MKILVLGANGFLGNRISAQGLKKGWQVTAVYHQNDSAIPNGCKKIKLGEVKNLKDEFDQVFLVLGNYALNKKELVQINCRLTEFFCHKFKQAKIIFVSSVEVCLDKPNDYGRAKIQGEKIVAQHEKYAIVRLTYLYGPGMTNHSFLPTIIQQVLKNKIIRLFGDGLRKQDYLHVNDAADLCLRAGVAKKNHVYLGVSGKSVTNLQIAQQLTKLIPGCKIEFSGKDKALNYIFKTNAATKALGWKPKYNLIAELKNILAYENSHI